MKALFLLLIFDIVLPDIEAIAGGRNVSIQEVPWLVMLKSGQHVWSGVLIDEDLVISIANFCKRDNIMAFGASSKHLTATVHGIPIVRRYRIQHPDFNISKTNDKKDLYHANLCIMKLGIKATINKNTQKAALPDMNEPMPRGVRYHVAGWGPANMQNSRIISVYPTVADFEIMEMDVVRSKDLMWFNYNDGSRERILYMGDEGAPIYIPEYGRIFGLVNHVVDIRTESHFSALKLPRFRDWIEEMKVFIRKGQ